MGKMKWYATMEDNFQQPIIRKKTQQQGRRPETSLGHWFQEQPDAPPLDSLFRQIFWRLRRHWLAFLFQANRYTLGFFKQRAVLKLGAVAGLGYFLLFFNQEGSFTPSQVSDPMQIGPVETSMNVSDSPAKGKSLNWKFSVDGPVSPNENSKPVARKSGNEAAPISSGQMRAGQTELYIERFSKTAVQEMHKFGIPASISLAQGLVESRYGTSKLAVRNNNHFGMKCFSKKCRNGHCSNFGDDHHKDFFRIFKTPWDSWRAHSSMLANGRYARLKKHGKNYRKWAEGLQSLGYATDRTYAKKLIGVIQKYNLQRFDSM